MLVAPHGGRRPPVDLSALPAHLRVNDLYTAEITRELGERLVASVIINPTQDRNRLDLNRTSQILRRAPWFLDLLLQEIGALVARHGSAEVVFLHGWNTGQAKCDIGVGAVEADDTLHVPSGASRTVTDTYLGERIAAWRAACAAAGIHASIGERYPGCHHNNVLQLFGGRDPVVENAALQQLAAWSRDGRVNALQLELGIPLRWPGRWRDQFVAAVERAFGDRTVATIDDATAKASTASRPRPAAAPAIDSEPQHPALQFYDPAVDVGMFAGVGRMGPRVTGGRLLLFLGGPRVALFTGEDVHGHGGRVAPLEFAEDNGALRLRFAGSMLLLEDGTQYLDLEAALAASQLTDAQVDLAFETAGQAGAAGGVAFGSIVGSLHVGTRHCRVNAAGFARAAGLRASGSGTQTMIAAAFGMQRGVLARAAEGRAEPLAMCFEGTTVQPFNRVRVVVSTDGDTYTPSTLELACDDGPPVVGRPVSRMIILRPTGRGQYLRVTFGVARFSWAELQGYGLYEHARPVPVQHQPRDGSSAAKLP